MKKEIKKDDSIRPSVTLLISAYNEEKVIGQKIENSLLLDYPERFFEIIVISDASNDNTDKIIKQYQDKNVKLLRLENRKGKTSGINEAIPMARGEIIIFSDANAFYKQDAVKKIVRNFADPQIGYVTGESQYVSDVDTVAGNMENYYWNYEIQLKKLETNIGSMVGADGAIYAIRKNLYSPLKGSDINDFVNPLQIIKMGYRGIYEPEALAYENPSGDFISEFKRKRRIINRSWRGLSAIKDILNPFKHSIYSIQLLSHKVLRWFIPFVLIILFFSNLFLLHRHSIYAIIMLIQIVFYLLAILGHAFNNVKFTKLKVIAVPYYFFIVNLASLLGILDAMRGEIVTRWDPIRK